MRDDFKYLISLCSERHQDFDSNKTKMPWDIKKKIGFHVTVDPLSA